MPYPEQGTSYTGAVVDKDIMQHLKTQPAADFLRFEALPTGGYTMQAKLPEWGSSDGRSFRIRANMNYFMRGLVRSCMDEQENLDTRKATSIVDTLLSALNEDTALPKNFLKLCNVPGQHQEDFRNFIDACKPLLTSSAFGVLNKFTEQVESLQTYRYALDHYKGSDDPEAARLLRESYPDYVNTLQTCRDTISTDPETEERILYPMDCLSYAASNSFFINMANEYRTAQHLQPIENYGQVELHFADQAERPQEHLYRAFIDHGYFTFSVDIGGQPKVLSLETTAPPAGKLLFRPGNSTTGVGIYPDTAAIEQFHRSRNLVTIPDRGSFDKLKKPRRTEFETILTLSRDKEYEAELDRRWEQMIADARNGNDAALAESIRNAVQAPTKRLEWLDIEAAAKEGQRRETFLSQAVQAAAERHPDAEIDSPRITVKETLKRLTERGGEYERLAKGDPELTDIVEKIRQYAGMDVTAVRGDYQSEQTLFAQIWSRLDTYQKQKEDEQMYSDSDRPENRGRYLVSSNLHALFSNLQAGTLDVNNMPEGTARVDGTKYPIRTAKDRKDGKFIRLPKDTPLFPHDPSPNDISQGQLGNCYLLAGLSTLAGRFPEKIRENMVDNGDGTVTVRFFRKQRNERTGEELGVKPVLVTVDKVVPEQGGSESCLWVQMIERAYVASGLHLDNNSYAEPVPSDLKERYARYAARPKSDWPGHEACPWLFDEENNLVPWEPDYSMIEAGSSSEFLEQFLGPDAPGERCLLKKERDAAADRKADKDGVAQHLCEALFSEWLGDRQVALEGSKFQLPGKMLAHVLFDRTEPFDENSADSLFASNLVSLLKTNIEEQTDKPGYKKGKGDADALKNAFNELKKQLTQPLEKTSAFARTICVQLRKHSRYDELVNTCLDLLEPKFGAIVDAAKVPEPYSGEYTDFDQQIGKNIQDAIASGNIVNAGTSGTTDTMDDDGVYNRHAYSVLGIVKKKIDPNGPELTFVRVRDPHGNNIGREYYLGEEGQVLKRRSDQAEGGVCDIELTDFCSEFANIYYNKLSKEMPGNDAKAPEREKKAEQPDANRGEEELKLIGATLSRYGKELRRINAELQATNKGRKDSENSRQFNALVKALPLFLQTDLHGEMRGKTVKDAADYFSMSNVSSAAEAYLVYCQAPENHRIGSRRANRVEMTSQLMDLQAAMQAGAEDPADYCRTKIAGLIFDGLKESQMNVNPVEVRKEIERVYNNLVYREHAINEILTSPAFAKMAEGKSFAELSQMSRKSMMETYLKFLKAQQQVAKESAAMKKQQARNVQRNRSSNDPIINSQK